MGKERGRDGRKGERERGKGSEELTLLTIILVKINGDFFSSCRREFFGIVKEALQQHFKISIDKLLKHLSQTGSDLTDDDIRSLTCTHMHTCTHI